jgi:hypothetical protein
MKNQQIKNLKRYAIVVCLSLVIQSCENPMDKINPNDLYGKISIDLEVELKISETHARFMEVHTDDFMMDIWTADGLLYQSYERLADIPEAIPLEPGNYYVSVHSPNENIVAFDNPYYAGESDIFSLNYGDEKMIPVTAVLANCMVSVIYQPSITNEYLDYSTSVSNSFGSLEYVKEEIRPGYFPLADLEIVATLSFINTDGTVGTKTLTGSISSPNPQTHYQISLDADQLSGTAGFSVTVDETLFSEIISITEGTTFPEEGPIAYGELIITEIMYNPAALPDTEGEWLEIFNTGSQAIDLFQLVIKKGTEVQHIVNEQLLLQPGDYLVLARNPVATVSAGYIYGSSLSLTNTGDDIVLANYGDDGSNGSIISSVDYGLPGFPDGNGASINLDPGSLNVDMAKSGVNWCLAVSAYDTGDLGTPGNVNDSCN